jgi:inhibitor of the pro-sigma K processing machinery
MRLNIQPEVVLYFALGLVLLYGLGWLLLVPLRKVLGLIVNSVLGVIALLAVNLIGSGFGYTILVNPFTALLTGFFGVPGVALAALLQWFL